MKKLLVVLFLTISAFAAEFRDIEVVFLDRISNIYYKDVCINKYLYRMFYQDGKLISSEQVWRAGNPKETYPLTCQ